jgi:ribulose bisphosphate carboxylase small subunit
LQLDESLEDYRFQKYKNEKDCLAKIEELEASIKVKYNQLDVISFENIKKCEFLETLVRINNKAINLI